MSRIEKHTTMQLKKYCLGSYISTGKEMLALNLDQDKFSLVLWYEVDAKANNHVYCYLVSVDIGTPYL